MKKIKNYKDKKLVYYGPHACQRCDPQGKNSTMIVRAGNEALNSLEFNFTHDSHYPNHVWKKHKCISIKKLTNNK